MDILLTIAYKTHAGEELLVNIITPSASGAPAATPYHMATTDGETWTCSLKLPLDKGTIVDYYYSVLHGKDNIIAREWRTLPHRLELTAQQATTYNVIDQWSAMPEDSYQYSSAFTDCLRHRAITPLPPSRFAATLRLIVRAPQLRTGDRLVLVGSEKVLGAWNVSKGVAMTEHNYNEWVADINAEKLQEKQFEYKFVIVNDSDKDTIIWEDRYNRQLEKPAVKRHSVTVMNAETALFPIRNTRCAGVLVPVFALRSKTSFGVGDFGDLKKMIDWVACTGQRVLQILPINDTTITHTWTDSYPYCSISIFALHPQYADLTALPTLKDKKAAKTFETLRRKLNALPQIDYEQVNNAKNKYLALLFEQECDMLSSDTFKTFFAENETWLVPYAQYCFFREKYGTADFNQWRGQQQFDEHDRKALSNPRTKAYKEVAYYYFIQYILHSQMAAVHAYARQKGVILKGDIPIGVSRCGCDVWQEPRYFNLNGQAGAPPDDFSANGQNWGFPTYNWEEMLRDNCQWWVRRFASMAKFLDAYRIDHVLGFFRIWEIPIHAVHGLLGQFVPALAMSREEIEAYGLHFQEELFTEPFITDWVLDRTFGIRAEEVRKTYLVPTHDGFYRMKDDFATQRQVEAAFAQQAEPDIKIRDGLYALISDVLFVRDHKDKNMFHPRISVQFDFVYEALYDSDKDIFNKIYNDYYYQRNNQFWYREAMNRLPKLVEATRMLVCAEDLGMVPDCVAWAMNNLKILSLELQSMPKDPHVRFGILEKNPYRSVCTISSHDTPTLRQWWDEDYDRTQTYFNTVLGKYGAAPHPLPTWLARDIIARHLFCPSMLCIISIQDWLAIDDQLRLPDANKERINIPANPRHYWRYRMHINIEDLLSNSNYNQNIADLIEESGRK